MKKLEFSKKLLVQESALVWIITITYIILAFIAVLTGYVGSLPWLSVIPGLAWSAYGVSQAFYYKKAQAENTVNGIKYETVMEELYRQDQDKEILFGDFPCNNDDSNLDYGI